MEPQYIELESSSLVGLATFCRLCANNTEYSIQIFSEEGKTHGLADKINKYLPISVLACDTLPTQICYQCASTLLAFSELVDTCLVAEKRFHYYFETGDIIGEGNRGHGSSVDFSERNLNYLDDRLDQDSTSVIGLEPESVIQQNSGHISTITCEDSQSRFLDLDANTEDHAETSFEDDFCGDELNKKKKRRKKDSVSKCLICGKGFQFVEYLRAHLLSHSENRPYLCHICGASFKRKDHVNRHRKAVHMNHPDVLRELEVKGTSHLTCDECGEVKSSKHLMLMHKKKHSLCSMCDICGESFNLPSLLKDHMVKTHPEIEVPCPICGQEMKTGRELYLHKQKHFTSYICDVCGKSFAQQSSLRIHMVVHSEDTPYTCDECGKSFKLKVRLRLHKQFHSNNRPFACNLCKDKRFKTKTALIVHTNMHNDTRPYPCPHCSFRARKNSDLVCHIRTHTGEKPYKCEVCGRGFAQAGDMRKHKSTHDRQRGGTSKPS